MNKSTEINRNVFRSHKAFSLSQIKQIPNQIQNETFSSDQKLQIFILYLFPRSAGQLKRPNNSLIKVIRGHIVLDRQIKKKERNVSFNLRFRKSFCTILNPKMRWPRWFNVLTN